MTGRRWWEGAVLYQLYVRSWQDSNGDGYGDLPGIIERLDYLSWLGVDGIWLSPTMPSPDQDWGYDVSDYLGVHPELGTLADLDRLIEQAGSRGLKVLLDLVPNHTSSAHPWFTEALTGSASAYRGYYVWADPAPRGGPPNNWLDATGQAAWALDPGSGQYYLHNFLPSQPDLNWWEPAVHAEFEQIIRFWFDRGVAGFRIDVAHGLYKDDRLRDDPPADPGPFSGRGLRQVYSANRPETHSVYRRWRSAAEGYDPPRLLLGETWVGDPDELASYYGRDDELQLAFNFPFVFADFTAGALADVVARTLASLPAGACPVWMASNHDVGRFPSRWCAGDDRQIRLALMLLLTLPGTTVLYYGDEIGMTNADVPAALRRDLMTSTDPHGGRDRGRTPMRWDGGAGGGFTQGPATPWLPLGDPAVSVAAQRGDPRSALRYCRDLIRLRRERAGGIVAAYEQLPAGEGIWRYRCGPLTITANLTPHPVRLPDPATPAPLLSSAPPGPTDGRDDWLAAWEGIITA